MADMWSAEETRALHDCWRDGGFDAARKHELLADRSTKALKNKAIMLGLMIAVSNPYSEEEKRILSECWKDGGVFAARQHSIFAKRSDDSLGSQARKLGLTISPEALSRINFLGKKRAARAREVMLQIWPDGGIEACRKHPELQGRSPRSLRRLAVPLGLIETKKRERKGSPMQQVTIPLSKRDPAIAERWKALQLYSGDGAIRRTLTSRPRVSW